MKYLQKTFLVGTFMCAPSFLVCARLTTRAREGTLVVRDRDEFPFTNLQHLLSTIARASLFERAKLAFELFARTRA